MLVTMRYPKIIKLLFTGIMLLVASTIVAATAGSPKNFYVLPASQSFRAIRTMVRDYQGFMWFGTESGLVRFDGVNQRLYAHDTENARSLSYSIINDLLEDGGKRLWIGTSRGLNFYNRTEV